MLTLVCNDDRIPAEQTLISLCRQAEPELCGIVLNENRQRDNRILGPLCRGLWGEERLEDTLCGNVFRLSPLSFYQVNHAQTEQLYAEIVRLAAPEGTGTVLDLYCGVGTITLALAKRCRSVTGVELVPQAIEDAGANAARNGVSNARFFCADAGQAAQRLAEEGFLPETVVVDPPRKGIDRPAAEAICRMAPRRIVYVACDPASLARDARLLCDQGGYTLRAVRAFDMFPRTANVETVCLLSKLQSKEHIEIEVAMDEMDLTSAESKATYEEIREYVFEHTGLKVSHLYIAQVKQKYGIIERENYNKPKSENAKQPQCPPEKEKAITEALRHFGMI